jgi:hypothetical protein
VFIYFFYVETKNTALEEIAKYFDGDAALVGGHDATGRGRAIEHQIEEKRSGSVTEEHVESKTYI